MGVGHGVGVGVCDESNLFSKEKRLYGFGVGRLGVVFFAKIEQTMVKLWCFLEKSNLQKKKYFEIRGSRVGEVFLRNYDPDP